MNQPFFSVIIPTLNEEEFLPRLLNDLAMQKERSFEVIVVDGASTDNTVIEAEKIKTQLPFTILTNVPQNVSKQRNLGAQKACGIFLVFLDADVQIPSRFLWYMKRDIQKLKGDFFTTRVHADSKKMYDEVINLFFNHGVDLSLLIDRPLVAGFNFIVSKKAFQVVGGFHEDIKHGEDVDLSIRLHKAGYPLQILKSTRLVFSLRRYRKEGRLAVIRKHARAGLHIFIKGPITRDLFTYPMGGGWYKERMASTGYRSQIRKIERYIKQLLKTLVE